MADKTIGSLPVASQLDNDSLLVVEQQSQARSIKGELIKKFAQAAAAESVSAAQKAAEEAQLAKQGADVAKEAAEEARTGAKNAKDAAETAKNAIENMTVSAETLPPESNATATKKAVAESFHIAFGIPRGKQGEPGPQGQQGIQGPPGPQGPSGVAVAAEGQYAFNIDENGHLILYYTGDSAPDFEIGEDGHLYLNIA